MTQVTRTDFTQMRCPIARSMAVLGERWAMLVLREAFYGATRFDAFERNLGIAPNILAARLRELTAHGLLEKHPDGAYRLTEKGRDAFPVFLALKRWGEAWMGPPEGPILLLEDAVTGAPVQIPIPRTAAGAPLRPEDVRIRPGPGASPALRARFKDHPDG
jgi:DNA-binding HxlR family transcriptional regulator